MSFLLDTNAISELSRPAADRDYLRWFDTAAEDDIFISVITIGELKRGVSLLPEGDRKLQVGRVVTNIVLRFNDRILPFDQKVADTWGELSARLRRAGVVIGAPDEMIAATSLAFGLTLVTRNTRHFASTGCALLSPWRAP
mgnify:CR=1 FL=1